MIEQWVCESVHESFQSAYCVDRLFFFFKIWNFQCATNLCSFHVQHVQLEARQTRIEPIINLLAEANCNKMLNKFPKRSAVTCCEVNRQHSPPLYLPSPLYSHPSSMNSAVASTPLRCAGSQREMWLKLLSGLWLILLSPPLHHNTRPW